MARALEALSKELGYTRAEWRVEKIGHGAAEDDFASGGDEILDGRTIVDIQGRHKAYRCMVKLPKVGGLLGFVLCALPGRTFELRLDGPDGDILDLENVAASLPVVRAAIASQEAPYLDLGGVGDSEPRNPRR